MANDFPSGISALHPGWPEAKFNVSGLLTYDTIVAGYTRAVEQAFGRPGPIESIHGAPDVRWNGGRIALGSSSPAKFAEAINGFASLNIGCFFTFTNHRLEVQDLADPLCNAMLDAVARRPGINGVIVSSELLSKHIAGRHPGLPQIASITKVAMEGGRGSVAYYQELGKRFHRYVVHPDDGFDLRLLDQLDRGKAEIILNENCLRDCGIRQTHYELIARQHQALARQKAGSGGTMEAAAAVAAMDEFAGRCPSIPMTRQIKARRRNCNFTPGEVKAVYDLGFRHFKLQGRRDNLFVYMYDLTRYTLEPDVAAPLILKALFAAVQVTPPAAGSPPRA